MLAAQDAPKAAATRPARFSEAEWEARQQLAACYRIFDLMGWDELIFNHITVKVPGEEGAFLINPYGLMYSEVKASNLVKIDVDGNKLDPDNPYPVNQAGFVQHAVFHRSREDAHAIIHTHATPIVAVCSVEGGLKPTNFYACNFENLIGYHDFEGVTVRPEEGERLVANLGPRPILMLRNHGPVVVGKTLPEAFIYYWALQRACEIHQAACSMGEPIVVSPEVVEVHQRDLIMAMIEGDGQTGVHEFNALVRKVDRIDPSWRE